MVLLMPFRLKEPWFAYSFLAIDQGPIIVMMENYRSGLLWNLFMSCPEVKTGMKPWIFKVPFIAIRLNNFNFSAPMIKCINMKNLCFRLSVVFTVFLITKVFMRKKQIPKYVRTIFMQPQSQKAF